MMRSFYRTIQALLMGSCVALIYGFGIRAVFGHRGHALELLNLGLAVLLSLALGALTLAVAPRRNQASQRYELLLPLLPYLLLGIVIATLS